MVNPGVFQGSRKVFMLAEKEAYSDGIEGGYAADAIAMIQRKYFKRYPLNLPHNEEPTEEFTAAVDDDAPEPDELGPDIDTLDEAEYDAAMAMVEVRRKDVAFRKAQIKRWHAYQYMKDHNMDPTDTGAHNPYRILLARLTGATVQKPRMKSSTNVWRRTQRPVIEEELRRRVIAGKIARAGVARTREQIAREMFLALDVAEREQWGDQAQEEHTAELELWKHQMEDDPSTEPADRQKCVEGLVNFVQPILDLICQATGWKASLIAGGPEPAHEGRLNVISVHSGTSSGDVKLTFGMAERIRYKAVIVPIYGAFLQKCYTTEECRTRALPASDGLSGLISMDIEGEGANFDSLGFAGSRATPPASLSPPSEVLVTSAPPTTQRPAEPAPATQPASRSVSPPPSPALSPPSTPLFFPSSPAISPPVSRAASPVAPVASPSPQTSRKKRQSEGDGEELESSAGGPQPAVKRQRTRSSLPVAAPVELVPTVRPRPRRTNPPATRKSLPPALPGSGLPSIVPPAMPPSGTSELPSPSSRLVAPEGSPTWFRSALAMLQPNDIQLGQDWAELIAVWSGMEVRAQFTGTVNLSAKGRPQAVKDWIQRARSPAWTPTIKDVAQFEEEFLKWWQSLQPKWRISGAEGPPGDDGVGDWAVLRKPGQNGLLSLLAALFFWGLQVHAENQGEEGRKRWSVVVVDCLSAFKGVARSHT